MLWNSKLLVWNETFFEFGWLNYLKFSISSVAIVFMMEISKLQFDNVPSLFQYGDLHFEVIKHVSRSAAAKKEKGFSWKLCGYCKYESLLVLFYVFRNFN